MRGSFLKDRQITAAMAPMATALLACCFLLAGHLAAPQRAWATFGDPGFESEELSAYTLRAEELKVGPAVMRYGIFGQLQLGTWFGLNFFGALNGDLKWTIYRTPIFALAAEVGVVHFDSSLVGLKSDFKTTAVPAKLHLTFLPHEALQLHAHFVYVGGQRPETQAPEEAIRVARFLGLTGEVVAGIGVEWRASPNFALIFEGSIPLVMYDKNMFLEGEDPTKNGQQLDLKVSMLGSFGPTNFRLGIGYGPSFLGAQGVYPVLDLFWRIY